ncbi:deaminase [Aureococcus anophagefferens]|uniref:Deaminase n=1 Tax=Aureococcus anophagefferens TaxID=44056 RepID=A0ABR1FPF2_AURAN
MTATPTTTPTDDMWMQRALELAETAVADQGEVPVGCVFVNDNNVEIASGANETNEAMCATRHAELVAIDGALDRAAKRNQPIDWTRCALYVTCEPCIMCASALSQLGIAKCYFGCRNDKFGGCGSILSLHEGNFDIVEGLRARPRPRGPLPPLLRPRNSRTLGSEAHGDKRTRRRTARDSGVDGDAAGGDGAGGEDGATRPSNATRGEAPRGSTRECARLYAASSPEPEMPRLREGARACARPPSRRRRRGASLRSPTFAVWCLAFLNAKPAWRKADDAAEGAWRTT